MRVSDVATAMALAALAPACIEATRVDRVYDGHVVAGRYIEPAAYAAFLQAAIDDAGGDTKGALAAYEDALRLDPDAAEIWMRIGDVRCRSDPRDGRADASFARALRLAPASALVWAAKARCQQARGDFAGARMAALSAVQLDATGDGANFLLAHGTAVPSDVETRTALVAVTVTARDPVVAWDALMTWARGHGDVCLYGRALRELARIAPARRDAVARAAEELAGAGEIGEAREVAAAAANSDERPWGEDHPVAARLAVDQAIKRRDSAVASARATRVRLGADELAGRALLAGDRRMATEISSALAAADPGAVGGRLAWAASRGDDLIGAVIDVDPGLPPASAAAFVAFGIALLRESSPETVRAVLARIPHDPIVSGDDRVVRPAVELAARGVLSPAALPPDGSVELAALRGEVPPEAVFSPGAGSLDLRHEFLALALAHPRFPRAKELAIGLRGAAGDPVAAAARALVLLGSGVPIAAGDPQALLAGNSADPLLAAAALRLAEKVGDHEVERRARAALNAVGSGRRTLFE